MIRDIDLNSTNKGIGDVIEIYLDTIPSILHGKVEKVGPKVPQQKKKYNTNMRNERSHNLLLNN